MSRKKLLWILGGALALCCIAGALFVFWQVRSIPPISEQLPENYSHLYVQIAYPLPKSRWPINSFIPIQVRAQGVDNIKQVELFINNAALDAQAASVDSFNGSWSWQPGVSGDFILIAKATSESGAVSLSEPVRITAIEAGFTVSPLKVEGGETLESIAQAEGVTLELLQQSNPDIDPAIPLPPHKLIFIPNLPAPVVNLQTIAALPITILPDEDGVTPIPDDASAPEENVITPVPDNSQPAEEPSGPRTNLLDDLNFMIQFNNAGKKQEDNNPKDMPTAPELKVDFKNCDVHLFVAGWSYFEEGFFVYRSRDGAPAERIHTMPPIEGMEDNDKRDFYDPGQYGTLVYYVSAFNILGEAASDPVTIALDRGLCPAPKRAGANTISLENGDLILPFQMDTAYLYLQINRSKAVRIPEGDRTFLPGSGVRFNVYDYLATQIDTIQAPDLKLHMEVWGWQGGMLKYAGDFDTTIHRPVLTICSVDGIGSCTNGSGKWVGSLNLPQDKPLNDLKYEMRWQVTSLTTAERIYFQLSAAPFTSDAYHATSNLLYASWMWAKGTEGTFEVALGQILYPDPPNTGLGWWANPGDPTDLNFSSNGLPVGKPFTLYLRMQPGLVMSGYNRTSNIVPLTYKTSIPPADMPPLASVYDSIYDVEILEESYKPPDFYEKDMWGCVVVDEDPTGQFAVGQIVCPGKAPAHDDCPGDFWDEAECLAKGTVNAVGFLYDNFVLGMDVMKDGYSEGIAKLIPGCDGSADSSCRKAVRKVVGKAMEVVWGIPDDMPQSEELIADSVAHQIVTSAAELEKSYSELDESFIATFCEQVVDCEKKISDYIKVQLKKDKSLAAQKACIHAYEAYFRGLDSVCLDPSIIVHSAPGSGDYPAMALVRVTRKTTSESIWAIEADQDKYQIFVTVDAEKFDQASQTTLTGPLYEQAQISIPWLKPGESIILPATLGLLGMDAYGTQLLYLNGTSHMRAVETCYSSDSSWDWVPCEAGGLDTWDFANPHTVESFIEDVEP